MKGYQQRRRGKTFVTVLALAGLVFCVSVVPGETALTQIAHQRKASPLVFMSESKGRVGSDAAIHSGEMEPSVILDFQRDVEVLLPLFEQFPIGSGGIFWLAKEQWGASKSWLYGHLFMDPIVFAEAIDPVAVLPGKLIRNLSKVGRHAAAVAKIDCDSWEFRWRARVRFDVRTSEFSAIQAVQRFFGNIRATFRSVAADDRSRSGFRRSLSGFSSLPSLPSNNERSYESDRDRSSSREEALRFGAFATAALFLFPLYVIGTRRRRRNGDRDWRGRLLIGFCWVGWTLSVCIYAGGLAFWRVWL